MTTEVARHIYVNSPFKLNLYNNTFNSGSAISSSTGSAATASVGGGGHIFVNGSVIFIYNCTFNDGKATQTGGSIYAIASSNIMIEESNFYFSESLIHGGHISADTSSIRIVNSYFSNSSALAPASNSPLVTLGGSIYLNFATASINNCTFETSTSTNYAGHLYTSNTNIEITNCRFSNGLSYQYGGSVYLDWYTNANFSNCYFNHNLSPYSGGHLMASNSIVSITSSTFNNSESSYGSVIYLSNTPAIIDSCSFSNASCSTVGGLMFEIIDPYLNPIVYPIQVSLKNCTLTSLVIFLLFNIYYLF